jgi:hypothetical protein
LLVLGEVEREGALSLLEDVETGGEEERVAEDGVRLRGLRPLAVRPSPPKGTKSLDDEEEGEVDEASPAGFWILTRLRFDGLPASEGIMMDSSSNDLMILGSLLAPAPGMEMAEVAAGLGSW